MQLTFGSVSTEGRWKMGGHKSRDNLLARASLVVSGGLQGGGWPARVLGAGRSQPQGTFDSSDPWSSEPMHTAGCKIKE